MSDIFLENKIAQMLMIGFDGYEFDENHHISEAIRKYNLGGVILFDLEEKDYRLMNIRSADQLQKLTSGLQSYSDNILLIGIDYEGGQVVRLKEEYGFPKTFSQQHLGELNDPSVTYDKSAEMAGTLRELGINLNFAPVVDLKINPENPIIAKRERSYSSDPEVVTLHAKEFIKAHRQAGVLTCLKHFPGHGSSATDSHHGFVDISDTWSESELLPYKKLVKDNLADCVMSAHIVNHNIDPNYPATLSSIHIDQELRNGIGFNGVVFSDDLHMGAIKDNYTFDKRINLAINAGIDILVISYDEEYKENLCENLINTIVRLVKDGSISQNRIEESYDRIMVLKNNIKKVDQ